MTRGADAVAIKRNGPSYPQAFVTQRSALRNFLVPGERLELSHGFPYQILSLARLPVSPPRQDRERRERT